jgi:hypothetical protein
MAVPTATSDLPSTQAVSTMTTMGVCRTVSASNHHTSDRPDSTEAGAATCARFKGHMRP